MVKDGGEDFCVECRKLTKYTLQKRNIIQTIDGKKYTFSLTDAICTGCGGRMNPPGLMTKNVEEINDQMVKDYGIDFCEECRKWTKYTLQKKNIVKKIGDKEYVFSITVAICSECGAEMSPLGLIDKNVEEINEQYENSKKITTNMR